MKMTAVNAKTGKEFTTEEKITIITAMREEGLSYRQIGKAFDRSKQTIQEWMANNSDQPSSKPTRPITVQQVRKQFGIKLV